MSTQMGRYFSNNLNFEGRRLEGNSPMDDRLVVEYQSDLFSDTIWSFDPNATKTTNGKRMPYDGMIVSVVYDGTNNGIYMLPYAGDADFPNYRNQSWDTTASNYDAEGWMKVNGVTQSVVYMDKSDTNETTQPGMFGGAGTANDPYYVATINGGTF